MQCLNCRTTNLKKAIFFNAEVDYCPRCLGLWFEEDELRQAKDEKDKDLNWLDIDLWQDKAKFKISPVQGSGAKKGGKPRFNLCPVCSVPLYCVEYGESKITVDLCNLCHGIWLDRGEFKKIIDYLKEKGKREILDNYLKNFAAEGLEVFAGPEDFKEELGDFLAILKLLNYKFVTQHPTISRIISNLPK